MYPIRVDKKRQTIDFDETVFIDSNSLTLEALKFVGEDAFSVHVDDYDGYKISVSRSRLESEEERDIRVAKEEAYMAEYRKRKLARESKKKL